MRWVLFLLVPALAGVGVALSQTAAPPQSTVTIALPNVGPTFKPGPGVALAQANCATCHSAAYVATQPPLSATQWTAEVTKMRKAYGAPIPDDAVAGLVQYLTATYGKH
jgi:sulfite dehydrogenase (cytochrome) subunit B